MIPVLLIVFPLVAGLLTFFIKGEKQSRAWVLVASLGALVVSTLGQTVFTGAKFLAAKFLSVPTPRNPYFIFDADALPIFKNCISKFAPKLLLMSRRFE